MVFWCCYDVEGEFGVFDFFGFGFVEGFFDDFDAVWFCDSNFEDTADFDQFEVDAFLSDCCEGFCDVFWDAISVRTSGPSMAAFSKAS